MKLKYVWLFSFLAVALWASAYPFTKVALERFSVESLSFLRYFFASLFFFVFICFKKLQLPKLKDIPIFILSGFIGYSFYIYAFNQGSLTISTSLSSIIISLSPIITVILSSIFYRENFRYLSIIAIAIQFIGIIIMVSNGGTWEKSIGVVWIFLASLSLAFFNVLQKHLLKNYRPLEVTIYSIFFATIILSPYSINAYKEIKQASFLHIANIVSLGIFPSAIGSLLWIVAISNTKKITTVTNFLFITPLLTTIYSFIIIKEIPSLYTIIGGLLIIAGSFYFQYLNNKIKIIDTN